MTGYAFWGSFCTLSRSLAVLESLASSGVDLLPIMSENVFSTDTRFWKAKEFCERVEEICKKEIVQRSLGITNRAQDCASKIV